MTLVDGRGPRVVHVAAVEYTATLLLAPQLAFLADSGYDARIVCAPDSSTFAPALSRYYPEALAFPRSPRPAGIIRALGHLAAHLREVEPDIVHLHTPAVALPSRLIPRWALPARTRVVYTVHGFAHVWDSASLRDAALERAERLLASRTDMLLFQSTEDLSRTQELGYRTRLRYLGNGVEDHWFDLPPPQRRPGPLRLLFVGRLIREKGLLDLVESVALAPDVQLTIVGSEMPSERDGAADAARRRAGQPDVRGRIRFLGAVAKDAMPEQIARCDAMVLPSYREGVPRCLLEGFAAGRPAVATDVRGCRELVLDGETGFLVPPRRPDLLGQALQRMATLPASEFAALSRAAGALAQERYRESRVFGRLVSAYEELGVPPPNASDAAGRLGAR